MKCTYIFHKYINIPHYFLIEIQAGPTDSGTGTSSCVPEGALIARRVSPSGKQTYIELLLIRNHQKK